MRQEPKNNRLRATAAGLACGALALLAGSSSQAQEVDRSVCDPDVLRAAGRSEGELSYRFRGNRCEGIYEPRFSRGRRVKVVSVVAGLARLQTALATPLEARWPAREFPGSDGQIRLRAAELEPEEYYRMDTRVPLSERRFQLPVRLLSALELTEAELGFLGWTSMELEDGRRDVYLPLNLAQGTAAPPESGRVELVIVPPHDLRAVEVSLAYLSPDGARIESKYAVPHSRALADEPLAIPLELKPAWGIHRVTLGLTYRQRGHLAEVIYCSLGSRPAAPAP